MPRHPAVGCARVPCSYSYPTALSPRGCARILMADTNAAGCVRCKSVARCIQHSWRPSGVDGKPLGVLCAQAQARAAPYLRFQGEKDYEFVHVILCYESRLNWYTEHPAGFFGYNFRNSSSAKIDERRSPNQSSLELEELRRTSKNTRFIFKKLSWVLRVVSVAS